MPSGHELDTELARMRRTLRRLMAVMTFGLIIGVGAIAAVVGVTLSSADKEAARSFDAAWRKDNGKETHGSQVRPATVAQAPAASANPSAAPTAAPKPSPSRPETTGAATPTPPPARTTPITRQPAAQTAGADHPPKTTPDQASDEASKKPDQATSHARNKHSRRFARTRAKPSDEERAYYPGEYGRPAPDETARGAQRPERVIVLRRPGLERRPQADAPSDYGGGRESSRDGLFGALFGAHPD